jgi:hypothetical protein
LCIGVILGACDVAVVYIDANAFVQFSQVEVKLRQIVLQMDLYTVHVYCLSVGAFCNIVPTNLNCCVWNMDKGFYVRLKMEFLALVLFLGSTYHVSESNYWCGLIFVHEEWVMNVYIFQISRTYFLFIIVSRYMLYCHCF